MKIKRGPFKDMMEVGDVDRLRNLERLDSFKPSAKNIDDGNNKKLKMYTK